MEPSNLTKNILKVIRNIVFENSTVQQKLNDIVKILVQELCVDVSSIYLLNKNGKIELFATEGLSKEAVNNTICNIGEGIVGHTFKTRTTMNISNVWNNEFFVYRPETAEDPYYTMICVPMIYNANVIGILSVQNRPNKHHPIWHQEILETLSGVIADLIIKSDLSIMYSSDAHVDNIKAVFLSDGVGYGKILFSKPDKNFSYNILQESRQGDIDLFREVFAKNYNLLEGNNNKVIAEINNLYGLEKLICEHIENGLMTTASIDMVHNNIAMKIENDYVSINILNEFCDSIIFGFLNKRFSKNRDTKEDDVIIVAKNMTSKQFLMHYANMGLRGVILEQCSVKSHIAILAKSLKIPLAAYIDDVFNVFVEGDYAFLDSSKLNINISKKFNNENMEYIKNSLNNGLRINKNINKYFPGIKIYGNVNFINEAKYIGENEFLCGAGLVRTEMFFAHLKTLPLKNVQIEAYSDLFNAISSKSCNVRFFDFSVTNNYDEIDYASKGKVEVNPDLGFRGIRILLENPSIIIDQANAIIKSANGKKIGISFPMIANIEELLQVINLIKGLPGSEIFKIGLFVEIPAIVEELEEFEPYVDFFQIGTNDLLQFFYAADRNCSMYQKSVFSVLTYPFLKFLKKILKITNKNNKDCFICGADASNILGIIALYEIGFRNFSVSLRDFEFVTNNIDSIDVKTISDKFKECMDKKIYNIRSELEKVYKD